MELIDRETVLKEAQLTSFSKDVTPVLLFKSSSKSKRRPKCYWPSQCNIGGSTVNILQQNNRNSGEKKTNEVYEFLHR